MGSAIHGDPRNIGKVGLKFKVEWKGYGPSEDTWEPIDGLSSVEDTLIKELAHDLRRVFSVIGEK